jgi:DNA-directed RNA polymerase I, II, and III subunit RPABC5
MIPIKCFTCGNVLADKYRYYCIEVRKLKIEQGMKLDKELYLTPLFKELTPEGKVLNDIGLHKMCCRKQMLTHVDI